MCKTTRSRNGSTFSSRARKNDLATPYKLTIVWCEYSEDAGQFVTTELKNSAGALVWSWLFSSDRSRPAQS